MTTKVLFLLIAYYVLIRMCEAESGLSTSFLAAIEPLIRLCNVRIYSHRCKFDNVSPIDASLETEAIQILSNQGIPIQYMLLPCQIKPNDDQISKTRSSRCETNLVFVDSKLNAEITDVITLQLPTAFNMRLYSDRDFTVLIYKATWHTNVFFPTPSWYHLLPENLILLPVHFYKSASATSADWRFSANVIGLANVYCSESQLLCFHWHDVGHLIDVINSPTSNSVTVHDKYMRQVGRRSSHIFGPNYNFNKVGILINANKSPIEKPFIEHVAKFEMDEKDKKEIIKMFSLFANKYEYYRIKILTRIFSNMYNATIMDVAEYRADTTSGPELPKLLAYPGFSTEGPLARHNLRLIRQYVRNGAFCLNKAEDELDILTILNPMDRWSWISVCVTMVTLGLMFWRLTHSPFLNLVAMLFAQGNGDPVKRFSGLVVLWSFTGMLLNSGISSLIGSFLVVPPVIKGLDDYQQLYEQGYKVVFMDQGNVTDKFVLLMATQPLGTDYYSPEDLIARKPYFLRIQEEAEVLPRFATSAKDFHQHLMSRGKRCVLASRSMAQKLVEFYSENIPGCSVFSVKETLGHYPHQWIIFGPNAAILYGALQAQIASGIMDYHENIAELLESVILRFEFLEVLRDLDPFYVPSMYYFRIHREYVPYLFTVQNMQGKLVFLIWLGGVVLSCVGRILENKRFWHRMNLRLRVAWNMGCGYAAHLLIYLKEVPKKR